MSLYLSRLTLNPGCAAVRGDLRNFYELHRTLSRGFSDDPDRYREARCLFRVEEAATPPQVLIQSTVPPDWSALQPGYLSGEAESKAFSICFEPGQRLHFRLLANPTRREPGNGVADPTTGKPKDGPRRALVSRNQAETVASCRAWLLRKGEHGGFEPLFFDVEDRGVRHILRGGKRAPYAAISFEGVLQVTDPERLAETVAAGIGTAKGFGFGLLSLARG